ncbi:hypothetical protein ACFY8O_33940 [Streptomyces argenteolus]|uniref:Ig-like domain-containing protein n=1 Tax=Streptomyces argenteolus TaxID=67274 RepID=A0ABW6XGL1_9ACTN
MHHTGRAAAAVLVVGGGIFMAPAVAAAPPADTRLLTLVSCPLGTEAASFQPGLTYTPQQTNLHIEGTIGPCLSVSNPSITSATFVVNGSGTASCTSAEFDSTLVVDWDSGPNSVIDYNLTINAKPNGESVFITVGEVVAGQFAGAAVVRTTADVTLDVTKCLTAEGLEEAAGPVTLTLVG